MFSRIIRNLPWRRLGVIAFVLAVVLLASTNAQWVDKASAQVSVAAEPSVEMHIYRVPTEVHKATTNTQWFTRVGLTEGGTEGQAFQYIVWVHVPSDWQLQWATTFSFTGDFTSTNMTRQFDGALDFIENSADCTSGGPANFGYKWQAWASPVESLPAKTSTIPQRYQNEVNLRGGLWVPSASDTGTLNDFRVVVGTFYDSVSDSTPDTYKCSAASFNTMSVVP
ncbi:MAG: hypothetical protein WBR18_15430 [Anaerolineales bacterium]